MGIVVDLPLLMVFPPGREDVPSAPAVLRDGSLDASLVAQLRRGEVGALDRLYARHIAGLLHLAARLTGSMESAEDVVHDVFVGLPRAVARYQEQGNFEGWLRRVVARRAVDHLRVVNRRQEVELDPESASYAAGDQMEVVTKLAIEDAIATLPETLRTVFVLRAVEGYSHAEIAELLDIRRNTVEVRFFRAVRVLRETLEESV